MSAMSGKKMSGENRNPRGGLRVVTAGPLTTIQDLGRAGHMDVGVAASGALDVRSHRLANRLVGNAESCATLEVTLGGLEVEFGRPAAIAVTGADATLVVDGKAEGLNARIRVRRGSRVRIGAPRAGIRSYLAVSGGVDAPELYGSRSTDLLSGLGPEPVADGDHVPLCDDDEVIPPDVDLAPVAPIGHVWTVRLHRGPRVDFFADGEFEALCSRTYRVDPRSNRVGLRLDGEPLRRVDRGELPSEGIVDGAVEVPGDGRPLVFLADHPTTGGYPVIAVVDPEDLPLLGQAGPGDEVRFRPAP